MTFVSDPGDVYQYDVYILGITLGMAQSKERGRKRILRVLRKLQEIGKLIYQKQKWNLENPTSDINDLIN